MVDKWSQQLFWTRGLIVIRGSHRTIIRRLIFEWKLQTPQNSGRWSNSNWDFFNFTTTRKVSNLLPRKVKSASLLLLYCCSQRRCRLFWNEVSEKCNKLSETALYQKTHGKRWSWCMREKAQLINIYVWGGWLVVEGLFIKLISIFVFWIEEMHSGRKKDTNLIKSCIIVNQFRVLFNRPSSVHTFRSAILPLIWFQFDFVFNYCKER